MHKFRKIQRKFCKILDMKYLYSFFVSFFGLRWRFPPHYHEFLQYDTMILQRSRIMVGDAGFKPGTSASEVWSATNEPPHLH